MAGASHSRTNYFLVNDRQVRCYDSDSDSDEDNEVPSWEYPASNPSPQRRVIFAEDAELKVGDWPWSASEADSEPYFHRNTGERKPGGSIWNRRTYADPLAAGPTRDRVDPSFYEPLESRHTIGTTLKYLEDIRRVLKPLLGTKVPIMVEARGEKSFSNVEEMFFARVRKTNIVSFDTEEILLPKYQSKISTRNYIVLVVISTPADGFTIIFNFTRYPDDPRRVTLRDMLPDRVFRMLRDDNVLKLGADILSDLRKLFGENYHPPATAYLDTNEVCRHFAPALDGKLRGAEARNGLGKQCWLVGGVDFKPQSYAHYIRAYGVPPPGAWKKNERHRCTVYNWLYELTEHQKNYLLCDGLTPIDYVFSVIQRVVRHNAKTRASDICGSLHELIHECVRMHIYPWVPQLDNAPRKLISPPPRHHPLEVNNPCEPYTQEEKVANKKEKKARQRSRRHQFHHQNRQDRSGNETYHSSN